MSEQVNVIGSGGHSRSVIALLLVSGKSPLGVYDNSFSSQKEESILNIKLRGSINEVPKDLPVILAVGSNLLREELFLQFSSQLYLKPLIHPHAYIDNSASIGKATLIFGNSFINAAAEIGDNNILNTGCIIEHESKIGNHNHLSIGAIIGGRVTVGNSCFIGAGAIVKDNITICSNVIVGAGGVVVQNIEQPGTYVGNPIRKIK